MKRKVSKAEFKQAYIKYRCDDDGWTDDYWRKFYEDEEGKKYFLSPPESERHSRLFITSSPVDHHMYFLTDESEESLFDYPGKE